MCVDATSVIVVGEHPMRTMVGAPREIGPYLYYDTRDSQNSVRPCVLFLLLVMARRWGSLFGLARLGLVMYSADTMSDIGLSFSFVLL